MVLNSDSKMILLQFSRPDFEYDIMSLTKSFFPNINVGIKAKTEVLFTINTTYLEDEIQFEFSGNEIEYRCEKIIVNYDDRKDTKNRLKRLLYLMLSRETNKILPWGTLSGIRPVKITLDLFENGNSEDYIRQYLKETYLLSDEKINISIMVAKKELDLLRNIDYKEGYSLYIGIPFCPSTCSYCSFTSFSISEYQDKVDDYLEALTKEINFVSKKYKNKKLNTIYIGGGTPTSLSASQMDYLLSMIKSSFDLSECREITVEAGRPDSITRDKLEVIKGNGIDRISINPQTMKEETLDIIGRKHTVDDVVEAFKLARECGFTNINMDIIIGLPNEEYEDIKNTLEHVLRLKPDSLTIHSLAIKRAAKLNTDRDIYKEYTLTNNEEIMNLTSEYAGKMGLEPYYLYRQKNIAGNMENIGYASPGKECIYNILIMEQKQSVLAIGAGAITKIVFEDGSTKRISNVKDIEHYINRIDEMIQRKEENFN